MHKNSSFPGDFDEDLTNILQFEILLTCARATKLLYCMYFNSCL